MVIRRSSHAMARCIEGSSGNSGRMSKRPEQAMAEERIVERRHRFG
jgi:hypothetical protein